jgi:hypothetical protein
VLWGRTSQESNQSVSERAVSRERLFLSASASRNPSRSDFATFVVVFRCRRAGGGGRRRHARQGQLRDHPRGRGPHYQLPGCGRAGLLRQGAQGDGTELQLKGTPLSASRMWAGWALTSRRSRRWYGTPTQRDPTISFQDVGGLGSYVKALKEMVRNSNSKGRIQTKGRNDAALGTSCELPLLHTLSLTHTLPSCDWQLRGAGRGLTVASGNSVTSWPKARAV